MLGLVEDLRLYIHIYNDRADKMAEGLSHSGVSVENTSLQVERSPQAQGEDFLCEKQRPGVPSNADNEIPIYVKGWRLSLISLG